MKIDWLGFFKFNDGNSRVNRNAVLGLNSVGLDVSAVEDFTMPKNIKNLNPDLEILLSKSPNYDFVVKSFQFTQNKHLDFKGKIKSGFMMWEVFKVSKEMSSVLNKLDYIGVSTSSSKVGFINSGVNENKIFKCQLGIDFSGIYRVDGVDLKLTKKSFKFTHIEVPQWRKGTDILIEAYLKAFNKQDDVSLIIAGHHYGKEWLEDTLREKGYNENSPEIIFKWKSNGWEDISQRELLSYGDCAVHPSRGEGFGFTPYEALTCGSAVICTGEGLINNEVIFPFKEYISNEVAEFISFKTRIVEWKHDNQIIRGFVAEPDLEDLISKMKKAYLNKEELERNRMNRIDFAKKHFYISRFGEDFKNYFKEFFNEKN